MEADYDALLANYSYLSTQYTKLKTWPIESWPWPFTPKEAKEQLCTRLQAEISTLEQEIAKMSKELD